MDGRRISYYIIISKYKCHYYFDYDDDDDVNSIDDVDDDDDDNEYIL